MAIKMALVILIAVWAGRKLDEGPEDAFPLWTLILSIVGVIAAIYIVIKDTAPR